MSKVIPASYVPLFDRLTGHEGRAVDLVLLDSAGLRSSLVRELVTLLNTTSKLTVAEFLEAECTVIDYGMPDFRALSVQSPSDLDTMASVIKKAIESFEPRLSRLVLKIEPSKESVNRAKVDLVAAVKLGNELRRVDFELAISPGENTILASS